MQFCELPLCAQRSIIESESLMAISSALSNDERSGLCSITSQHIIDIPIDTGSVIVSIIEVSFYQEPGIHNYALYAIFARWSKVDDVLLVCGAGDEGELELTAPLLILSRTNNYKELEKNLNLSGEYLRNLVSRYKVIEVCKKCIVDVEEQNDQKQNCCICGKQFQGFGHSPFPCEDEDTGRCCDACNEDYVLPARIRSLFSSAYVDSNDEVKYCVSRDKTKA